MRYLWKETFKIGEKLNLAQCRSPKPEVAGLPPASPAHAQVTQWIEHWSSKPAFACFRIAPWVHEPPETNLERFLSMIRFDTRQKLEDLPDFQLDS